MERAEHFSFLSSEIEAVYHEAALKFGISDSNLRILYSVCLLGDGCLLHEVVRLTAISKQTINSSLRKLEERGILELKPFEGRNKRIYLTAQGNVLAENSALKVLKIESEILSSWTESEREQYIDLTAKYLSEFKKKIGAET